MAPRPTTRGPPARSRTARGGHVSAVADAVRMEWVRLSTIRSTAVLLGLALLLPAAIAVLVGLNSEPPLDASQVVAGLTAGSGYTPLPLPAVFAGVLGVLSVGHDYEHGTGRAVLTAVPRRSALLTGRLGLLAVAVAVAAVVGVAVDAVALALHPPVRLLPRRRRRRRSPGTCSCSCCGP